MASDQYGPYETRRSHDWQATLNFENLNRFDDPFNLRDRQSSARSTSSTGFSTNSGQRNNDIAFEFANIWDFLQHPRGAASWELPPAKPRSRNSIADGLIIYIQNNDARIHSRVMVVLAHDEEYFTCLSLCRTYLKRAENSYKKYWPARTIDPLMDNVQMLEEIRIILRPQLRRVEDEMFRGNVPTDGERRYLTLDTALSAPASVCIGRTWNLEYDTRFRILGYVDRLSLTELKRASIESFSAYVIQSPRHTNNTQKYRVTQFTPPSPRSPTSLENGTQQTDKRSKRSPEDIQALVTPGSMATQADSIAVARDSTKSLKESPSIDLGNCVQHQVSSG